MCSSNCADQHAHFPGRAVAYAASIRWALNYDLHGILSFKTHCKHFNQDCRKICSSLQQQAPAAASASAAAATAAAAATSAASDSSSSSDASRVTKP
jgi:hypothetical protein